MRGKQQRQRQAREHPGGPLRRLVSSASNSWCDESTSGSTWATRTPLDEKREKLRIMVLPAKSGESGSVPTVEIVDPDWDDDDTFGDSTWATKQSLVSLEDMQDWYDPVDEARIKPDRIPQTESAPIQGKSFLERYDDQLFAVVRDQRDDVGPLRQPLPRQEEEIRPREKEHMLHRKSARASQAMQTKRVLDDDTDTANGQLSSLSQRDSPSTSLANKMFRFITMKLSMDKPIPEVDEDEDHTYNEWAEKSVDDPKDTGEDSRTSDTSIESRSASRFSISQTYSGENLSVLKDPAYVKEKPSEYGVLNRPPPTKTKPTEREAGDSASECRRRRAKTASQRHTADEENSEEEQSWAPTDNFGSLTSFEFTRLPTLKTAGAVSHGSTDPSRGDGSWIGRRDRTRTKPLPMQYPDDEVSNFRRKDAEDAASKMVQVSETLRRVQSTPISNEAKPLLALSSTRPIESSDSSWYKKSYPSRRTSGNSHWSRRNRDQTREGGLRAIRSVTDEVSASDESVVSSAFTTDSNNNISIPWMQWSQNRQKSSRMHDDESSRVSSSTGHSTLPTKSSMISSGFQPDPFNSLSYEDLFFSHDDGGSLATTIDSLSVGSDRWEKYYRPSHFW